MVINGEKGSSIELIDDRPSVYAAPQNAYLPAHMKIDIVLVYIPRYKFGHEQDFVPPITGIHLAALTPSSYEVRVVHQQVEEPALDTDADIVAISFFSGFAPEAYSLAQNYRSRGKIRPYRA